MVGVGNKLLERLFEDHFIVVLDNALVHGFLALPDLGVPSQGSETQLQEPFLPDHALNFIFERL